ncbi:hypothetical protein MtrunA17_Chr1g0177951 [Medicago truncatula]|uniref:Uncharacterized protein n=1 Tax=Medicago truncatula TaxID=3880 RepID=A0A396JT42_MEDTR|nr:hypothetical protein MtrunA17_Chr1g0177951 [Medicago truncatula]
MIAEYERRKHNKKTRRMKRKMKVFFEVGKLYALGEEDKCVLPLPGMKGLQFHLYCGSIFCFITDCQSLFLLNRYIIYV